MADIKAKEPGQTAYEAFRQSGFAFAPLAFPEWDELTLDRRGAWAAVERAVAERCIRICAERSFIKRGSKSRCSSTAWQMARDIAALLNVDFDSIDFSGTEQKNIRSLYWADQQESAEADVAQTGVSGAEK